jgi:Regulator of chromosome condensation (RCC1) repeat
MARSASSHLTARSFAAGLLIIFGAAQALGADSYSGGRLSIPSLQIGSATYANVVVTVGPIVTGPADTMPYLKVDSYNPANNQLTVPAVSLGGTTYYNVVVPVTGLVSIGSVSGADTYSGGELTIPAVQVGASVYSGVVTVASVVHATGGLPKATQDSYDFSNGQLSIPVVLAGGKVFTNVTITVRSIISASATPGIATPAVAAGQGHSCALGHTGLVWCWGANSDGELGNGGTSRSDTPVPAVGLPLGLHSGVTAIVAGQYHSCALTRLGAVLCWGYDANGELGDGQVETQSSTPVPVIGLSGGAVSISAGGYDTCVITTAEVELCWGAASGATTPTRPNLLNTNIVAIAAGSYNFCSVTSGGTDVCWGLGPLGNPNTTSTITPYPVLDPAGTANLPGMVGLSAGYSIVCAYNGSVYCWGSGPLGDGVTVTSTLPVQVLTSADTPLSGVGAIATGNQDACALLTASGSVMCWGYDAWGQLGIGSNSPANFATAVTISDRITGISMGEDHTCAVTIPGSVWCWGLFGSVGNVSGNGSEVPSQVVGVGGVGFLQL